MNLNLIIRCALFWRTLIISLQKKLRMNVGEEFEFNGILLRVEREMSDFSCEGCFFKYISTKNEIGCLTTSEEKVFDCCKHDHIIFICLNSEKGDPFIEKRRKMARMR